MSTVKARAQQCLPSASETPSLETCIAAQKELEEIHRSMVITYTDKSQHDMAAGCKLRYIRLLWEELHSGVYTTTALTPEQVIANHDAKVQLLGRVSNTNHRYLYGAYKLHKNPPSMRWIAGNHLAQIGAGAQAPACTLSPVEAAVGGILRSVMTILDLKDRREFRPRGVKRYWVVTSVDTVAADLKSRSSELAKLPVWTRDFTTMYTNLSHQKVTDGVINAIAEAIEYHNKGRKSRNDRFQLKYDRLGNATASLAQDGLTCGEVEQLIKATVEEVFLQVGHQGTKSPAATLIRQQVGMPMGGKASSELANVFCYSVESSFIDSLLEKNKWNEARMWANTWRYIDDILGFGDRLWEIFNYGMEHKDTSLVAHNEVVFLGMHVKRTQRDLLLEVWQKGTGWQWKPQRFIDFTSCHTPWTKKFLLKSLLVRAATICSTTASFKRAVEHYVQGLLLRGCGLNHLQQSWDSFASSRLKHRWKMRNELSAWFRRLIGKSKPQSPSQNDAPRKNSKYRLLLCGLNAVNAVLSLIDRPPISREQLDDLNDNLAVEEALIVDEGVAIDNATDPRGNYPVEVLMTALRTYADCKCDRLQPQNPPPGLYLVGNGLHWQVAAASREGQWSVYDDGLEYPIGDVHAFFRNKFHIGAVIQLTHPLIASKIGQQGGDSTSEFMEIFGGKRPPLSKRKAEGEHEDAPAGQAINIEDDSNDSAEPALRDKESAHKEGNVTEPSPGSPSRTNNTGAQAVPTALQSKRTQKSGNLPSRDSPPHTRSRSRDAVSMPPPTPRPSTIPLQPDTFSLPCVRCSNQAAIPTKDKRTEFEVVNSRCLNCYKLATSQGHFPSSQPKIFGSKDERDAFVRAFWVEDDDGDDGVL